MSFGFGALTIGDGIPTESDPQASVPWKPYGGRLTSVFRGALEFN